MSMWLMLLQKDAAYIFDVTKTRTAECNALRDDNFQLQWIHLWRLRVWEVQPVVNDVSPIAPISSNTQMASKSCLLHQMISQYHFE